MGWDTTDAVTAAGLRLAYRRTGSGPPVLLLHGGASDSREWRHQAEALADEFTLVAWDAPGCGGSSDPPASFRLPDYADCLAAFVTALGLDRPHVVGLSFGGGLALELYRRAPGLPRSLVLASAYAGWAGSLPPDVVAERLASVLADADTSPEDLVAHWLPSLFSSGVPPEVVDALAAIMADARPAGVRPMARAFAEADLRDVCARVAVPTLLLYGEEDVRAPRSVAEDLHARVPQSTLVLMPGVGHQANMEAPGTFSRHLRDFLRVAPA